MYVYKQLNTKKVQEIDSDANKMDAQGWELIQVLTQQDRFVSIFRKPRQ